MSDSNYKLLQLLDTINEPSGNKFLTNPDILDFATINDTVAQIMLKIEPENFDLYNKHKATWQNLIMKKLGLTKVDIAFTKQNLEPKKTPHKKKIQTITPPSKNIIAIASAKGGVGKSTVATNLALSFRSLGFSCGLLDADVYGPSIPRLLGITAKPKQLNDKIIPVIAHDIKVMSMGFLVDETTPLIWRGPMVMSAIEQMLRDVDWGNPDILVIDLPPGTGDAQLTLIQKIRLQGAVIVTTPQDIALIDVCKGIEMFNKLNVPLLGIVENMASFTCDICSTKHELFGSGKVAKIASKYNTKIIASLPLSTDLCKDADNGKPVEFDSEMGKIFYSLGNKVIKHLKIIPNG